VPESLSAAASLLTRWSYVRDIKTFLSWLVQPAPTEKLNSEPAAFGLIASTAGGASVSVGQKKSAFRG
jgi:hypothetical protein